MNPLSFSAFTENGLSSTIASPATELAPAVFFSTTTGFVGTDFALSGAATCAIIGRPETDNAARAARNEESERNGRRAIRRSRLVVSRQAGGMYLGVLMRWGHTVMDGGPICLGFWE